MTDLFPTNLSDGPVRPPATVPNGLRCGRCGSTPAANVAFRKHIGMVVVGKTETEPGPFCRDCGISWFRATTAQTLCIGWLGVTSLLVYSPIVIVRNVLARRKIVRLGPPVPPPNRRPFSPGRPLFLRLESAVILIPLAFIAFMVVNSRESAPENQIGKCVGSAAPYVVDCAQPHVGVVTAVVDRQAQCTEGSFAVLEWPGGAADDKILCIR